MNTTTEALKYIETTENLSREACLEISKVTSRDVLDEVSRIRKAAFFVPDNARLDSRKDHVSPSGKYRLSITQYHTGPNSWQYSQGLISDQKGQIAEIQRNYSSFPFLFIEGHPNGHDYLVAGAHYQGQTVIELNTGKRLDILGEFCWSEYKFEAGLLIVIGCYWGGPYDYKFFDFSDPMSGWPELDMPERDCYFSDGDKWPTLDSDGKITCYQIRDSDEDDNETEPEVVATITMRREGKQLLEVASWTSKKEQERRDSIKEANRRYAERMAQFRASDPLYAVYKDLIQDPILSPGSYESVGYTNENWAPNFTLRESKFCRRVVTRDKSPYTIELEWGMATGPIKLEIYKDRKIHDSEFFEHSVEGMKIAFQRVFELARAS